MVRWGGDQTDHTRRSPCTNEEEEVATTSSACLMLALDIKCLPTATATGLTVKLGLLVALLEFYCHLHAESRYFQGEIIVAGYASFDFSLGFLKDLFWLTLGMVGLYVGKLRRSKRRPIYIGRSEWGKFRHGDRCSLWNVCSLFPATRRTGHVVCLRRCLLKLFRQPVHFGSKPTGVRVFLLRVITVIICLILITKNLLNTNQRTRTDNDNDNRDHKHKPTNRQPTTDNREPTTDNREPTTDNRHLSGRGRTDEPTTPATFDHSTSLTPTSLATL